MQRTQKKTPSFAAWALAAALGIPAAAAPGPGYATDEAAAGASRPPMVWADCGDGFQCGTVQVPLDHARPQGGSLDIALVRQPAIDQAHRIGSLFYHLGGAGLGASSARGLPPAFFQAFPRFDIVGFDVRGVGLSRPAMQPCTSNPANAKPFPRPQTTDARAFTAAARRHADSCLARNALLLPHLSTANIARDLDRLRIAVGDARLNYLGISFGSVIGANYATLFPGRARALMLDSPLDVQDYYDRPLRDIWERAQGHERALARFLDACRAAGARCGFGGGDPHRAYARLQSRLDRAGMPSPDPADPRRLSGDDLRETITYVIADSAYWPAFAAMLAQAEAGDPRALLDLFVGADAPEVRAVQDFYQAMVSVDQRWPRGRRTADLRIYFDVAARAQAALPHLFFATGYPDVIHGVWPARDAGAFRGRIRNPHAAAPILVVASTHDAAAPYAQAQALVRSLGNARLLTRKADAHVAILDPCVLGHAARYFERGLLPPKGEVCDPPDEPFPDAEAARAAGTQHMPMPMPMPGWRGD